MPNFFEAIRNRFQSTLGASDRHAAPVRKITELSSLEKILHFRRASENPEYALKLAKEQGLNPRRKDVGMWMDHYKDHAEQYELNKDILIRAEKKRHL